MPFGRLGRSEAPAGGSSEENSGERRVLRRSEVVPTRVEVS